jgi:hypothetical protein
MLTPEPNRLARAEDALQGPTWVKSGRNWQRNSLGWMGFRSAWVPVLSIVMVAHFALGRRVADQLPEDGERWRPRLNDAATGRSNLWAA